MSESNKKSQIVLTHTSRIGEDYLKSLEFRYDGKYDRGPHFVILKNGKVVELLESSTNTNFFQNDLINKNSIIICLENLGWLNKDLLAKTYSNWIGNKVENVKEKKWRLKSFWDFYTLEQTDSLIELCDKLCEKHNIPKKFIGNNTKITGSENFEGIISRSNFDEDYTDLSPAFNFVYLLEKFSHD
jgi:N-acetyl-anhydromuramyl-L-alanine amidase AmpD